MITVGIIGFGKVGVALASYIQKSGKSELQLKAIYSRRKSNNQYIQGIEDVKVTSIREVISKCDVIFVTTTDYGIRDVASQIEKLSIKGEVKLDGKCFVHCSGALSTTVFDGLVVQNALAYSLHPLKAFSGSSEDVKGLGECNLTIEVSLSNRKSVESTVMNQVLALFEGRYSFIESSKKSLYHAAAVMLSNYMVTLIHEGFSYLKELDFEDETIINMMMPLMEGTLKNIKEKGTIEALTGPIVRGDQGIVNGHIESIAKYLSHDNVEFYKQMGKRTIDMIKGSRITDESYQEMDVLFVDPLEERRTEDE